MPESKKKKNLSKVALLSLALLTNPPIMAQEELDKTINQEGAVLEEFIAYDNSQILAYPEDPQQLPLPRQYNKNPGKQMPMTTLATGEEGTYSNQPADPNQFTKAYPSDDAIHQRPGYIPPKKRPMPGNPYTMAYPSDDGIHQRPMPPGQMTTMAMGEEAGGVTNGKPKYPPKKGIMTTMAMGEEGNAQPQPMPMPMPTTMALGEEGGPQPQPMKPQ